MLCANRPAAPSMYSIICICVCFLSVCSWGHLFYEVLVQTKWFGVHVKLTDSPKNTSQVHRKVSHSLWPSTKIFKTQISWKHWSKFTVEESCWPGHFSPQHLDVIWPQWFRRKRRRGILYLSLYNSLYKEVLRLDGGSNRSLFRVLTPVFACTCV